MINKSATRRALLALVTLAACAPGQPAAGNAPPPASPDVLRTRDIAYGSHLRQSLDVYKPRNAQNAPVLIFYHGGAWVEGNKDENEIVGRAFAARGYCVVIPNYRLLPEFRFPVFNEDAARAARWTQDHIAEYGGDPHRIVLSGYSAGAYLAVMLALDTHYFADAGVNAQNIKGTIGIAGPYDFYPFRLSIAIDAFGDAPDPLLTQPVHFARGDAPPLFLQGGALDTLVQDGNLDSMARAMRARGGAVDTKIYADLDHAGMWFALGPRFHSYNTVFADALAFADRVTAQL